VKTIDIIYRYGSDQPAIRPRPHDSAAALARLVEGNRDFATLLNSMTGDGAPVNRIISIDPHDLGIGDATAASQHPFAAILGCADARVPVELIFNEGPNDLFVLRVAGNGLGNEVLGSLRYAVDHLGDSMKLIVVLGHSGCGAVTAAADVFLRPSEYLRLATQHSLRLVLDNLLVVIQACALKLAAVFGAEVARRPGYRHALIEAAIVTNAVLSAHSIQQALGSADVSGLSAAYGVYLLETREVWAPRAGNPDGSGLALAPGTAAEFSEIGEAIARSDRIAAIIARGS
jgi:carbonic anhydrase